MISINADYENSEENFMNINSDSEEQYYVDTKVEYMELVLNHEDDFEELYCVHPEVEYREYIERLKDEKEVPKSIIRWGKGMNEFI